jgi:hypothetical protein
MIVGLKETFAYSLPFGIITISSFTVFLSFVFPLKSNVILLTYLTFIAFYVIVYFLNSYNILCN